MSKVDGRCELQISLQKEVAELVAEAPRKLDRLARAILPVLRFGHKRTFKSLTVYGVKQIPQKILATSF